MKKTVLTVLFSFLLIFQLVLVSGYVYEQYPSDFITRYTVKSTVQETPIEEKQEAPLSYNKYDNVERLKKVLDSIPDNCRTIILKSGYNTKYGQNIELYHRECNEPTSERNYNFFHIDPNKKERQIRTADVAFFGSES